MGFFGSALTGALGGLMTGGPVGAAIGGVGGLLGGGGMGAEGMAPFNLASQSAALTQAISQTQQGVRAGTGSPQELSGLVTTYHALMGGPSTQQQMLQDMQQQNMQNLMFQQQVDQQSQQFTTLSAAQKAMHDAIMAMLNNAK